MLGLRLTFHVIAGRIGLWLGNGRVVPHYSATLDMFFLAFV